MAASLLLCSSNAALAQTVAPPTAVQSSPLAPPPGAPVPASPTPAPSTPAPSTPGPAPTGPGLAPSVAAPAQPDPDGAQEVMLEARPALALRGEAKWEDGFATLTRAFATLRTEADKAGLKTLGNPLAHFMQTDDQGFRYEALLPLAAPPPAGTTTGTAIVTLTPAGRTLRFPNTGAYDDIDTVYEAITAYLDEKGLTAKGAFVEEYIALPATSEDPGLQLNIFVFIQ